MNLDDLKGKAEELVNDVKNAVASEEQTDALLDKAAEAAKSVTGGKFDSQIDSARAAADEKLGE